MPLGLSKSIASTSGGDKYTRSYIKDNLKLYMPYRGADNSEVQFVGTGSTYFVTNDYISCGNDSSLQFGTGDFSVSVWVKRGAVGAVHQIAGYGDDDGIHWYLGYHSDNKLRFRTDDTSTDTSTYSSSTVADTNWHHIAVTCDRDGDTKFYIDGSLDNTTDHSPSSSTLTHASDPFLIGARNSGGSATQPFNGSIKNVAIWNRVLTATEVQNVMYKSYAEVSGRRASGLVSWWALDVDYTDYHGDNDGTNSGSTLDTDLYGGDTPVKPRAIDNAPTVQADAIGSGSALFDGTDDYISITETTLDTDGNCSISFWHKHGGAGATAWAVLGHTSTANERYLRFLASDGKLKFESDTGGDVAEITLNTAFTDEQWHHYALVFTSGTLTAYQDSVSLTVANPSMSDDTTINLIGGQHTSGDSYNISGNLAQFGIWDAALTQEQIQSIMEKTYEELTASEKTNLVSYWALDVDGSDSHGDNDGTLT